MGFLYGLCNITYGRGGHGFAKMFHGKEFIYMSKHSDGEAKLHIPLEQRGSAGRIKKQPPSFKDNMAPQVPPKGTNANNQYR
jgi:hypothetical protein